ncbi:RNA polymerase sigma factor [Pseudonocardia spinosispora]|uniref:RNA polymerase sigma factor n=1 Tax=Pseudonocardia spinosispora TaxID=103441 RepID=UPI000400D7B7|nr:DUF6596 domain-containing protein [Pseudonocardia spinosispora]
MEPASVEGLVRDLAPQVLGAVVRRYGHFDAAEDAVQEALLAAAVQWPRDGVPDDPKAWLITVAARRLTDLLRADQARRRREDAVAARALPEQWWAPAADRAPEPSDDSLTLMFLCCHPALSPSSQIALTLRAVGGLGTGEIARAFLVPEATMTRRISRAKRGIVDSGVPFGPPPVAERDQRLASVLHVLYLIFTEGYTGTSAASPRRGDLTGEAIRLTRLLHRLLPEDGEVTGLLALMLLIEARRAARTSADGALVPMDEQDRDRWDTELITEGVALVTEALGGGVPGEYQLQAAINAVHDEAPSAEKTDWAQIVALYELLMRLRDNPVVALNHAVAVAMARGAEEGLALVARLAGDPRLADDHRLFAVRAHLLERNGDHAEARDQYLAAARRATHAPHQRYLNTQASRLPS